MSQPGQGSSGARDPRQGSNGKGRSPSEAPRGKVGLSKIPGSEHFELVHPRCVLLRKEDYEEGMELWKSGDPEGARDALRYALEGCGDNLWVHVALGRIALEAFRDPQLARGHFGYAYELVEGALPRNFRGRIPRKLPGNRPFFDAVEGLATSYEALGQSKQAAEIRARGEQLSGQRE